MPSVKNKVVIITGGSCGIGKATAKLFAQERAKVAIVARNKTDIDKTVWEIKEIYKEVVGIKTDIRYIEQVEKMVKKVVKKWARVDILINNAGVSGRDYFLKQTLAEWNKIVDTNLRGMLNCTYTVAPFMIKQKDGIIINISSGAGKTGYPQLAVYSATKFAVLGFTQGFAQEVEDKGVRVWAVCPGMTKTRMSGFVGMPAEKVAKRILDVAQENLGLTPGEDTEIYSL